MSTGTPKTGTPTAVTPEIATRQNADQCLQSLLTSRQECRDWMDAKWIPFQGVETLETYEAWLEKGHHGEMEYLARHLALKRDPALLLPGVRSLILVTKSYVPPVKPHGVFANLRMAAYARGRDYHEEFGDELKSLARHLEELFPGAGFRAGTDSLPVLERDLARQAGLGWVGKNTCLIHPKKGSFFFIGAILSTVPVSMEPAPLPDFCGNCTRCLDACPTGALEAPRALNATKCISYWTIESRALAPPELSSRFGDWFFGCDICQSVCPWNAKPLRGEAVLNAALLLPGDDAAMASELREVLTMTDTDLRRLLKTTPLSRAKPVGLRRNALVVIGNRRLLALLPEVEALLDDPDLGELAARTRSQLI